MRATLLALLVVSSGAACSATGGDPATAARGAAPRAADAAAEPAEVTLPEDWLARSPRSFEALVDELGAALLGARFGAATVTRLAEGLTQPGEPAVRAAVLLAHAAAGGDGDARDALLARLERRAHAPSRSEAGGDVTAAAALQAHATERDVAARLAALATGERAHPELDVRVECARGALAGGRDEVAPFLLAVLRAETPDEVRAPRDWPRTTSLYWAKARAAEALAARAGVPDTFRPDASWQDQMDAATALEEALRGSGVLR